MAWFYSAVLGETKWFVVYFCGYLEIIFLYGSDTSFKAFSRKKEDLKNLGRITNIIFILDILLC